jgi:CheY-like chemotaxis protein
VCIARFLRLLAQDFNAVAGMRSTSSLEGGRPRTVQSTGLGLPINNRYAASARALVPKVSLLDALKYLVASCFSHARALGTLTVANRGDGVRGVCFCLSLPLEAPTAAAGRQSSWGAQSVGGAIHACPGHGNTSSPAAAAPLNAHVLVVDDSAMNRRIAERLLRGFGCTCTLAEDGDEVPAAVAREDFDVILMDIRMVRMNGDAACAALRAGGFAGPVVAVTGNATAHDAADYAWRGFTATLGKPFGPAELRGCLEAALRQRHAAASSGEPAVAVAHYAGVT